MKTLDKFLQKILPQKGQGLLEYALLLGFVATLLYGIAINFGFLDSLKNLFGSSGDSMTNINYELGNGNSDSSSSGGSDTNSSASENSTAGILIPSPAARPLDWQEILRDIKLTFTTITQSQDPNRAIASEYNLFAQISNLAGGAKEYNIKESDVKGWNDLMAQMESQMNAANFTSTYKKSSTGETFSISRKAGTNRVTLSYFDGNDATKTFTIYADSNNVMQVESPGMENNSAELYSKYMSMAPNVYSGGWTYSK